LIIVASSRPSLKPVIHVTSPTESCCIICRPNDMVFSRIATLAIDQSALATGLCKILSFLSTGELMCYQLKHNPLSLSQQFHCSLPVRRNLCHPVVQAVCHHPLLVTLSQDFTISLYNLELGTVKLTQTLSSFTSFPPVSLILSTPSPSIYKLVLAYAIPVHPRHWTAGATELMISGARVTVDAAPGPSPHDPSLSFAGPSESENWAVLSTRTARAIDVPFGWIDERKLRIMREQWSRKVTRVADIQTDGKWIILAPGDQLTGFEHRLASPHSTLAPSYPTPISPTDNPGDIEINTFTAQPLHSPTSLQLYRLILPPHNSVSSSLPRLSFVRTLHGQTGPVTALALSDGRCVSLSLNGSIWVWDLEAGTGAQVSSATIESTHSLTLGPDAEPIRGSVSFDEKRLIVAQSDNVVIRRFDV
jgi:WD40 repeat protein